MENLHIRDITDDSENGYILEFVLEYQKKLHDDHNEIHSPPEKLKLTVKNYCAI